MPSMKAQSSSLFEAPLAHELVQQANTCNCWECRLNRELVSENEKDYFATRLFPGLKEGHEILTREAIKLVPGIDQNALNALLRGVTRPDKGNHLWNLPGSIVHAFEPQFQKSHALRKTFNTSTPAALTEITNHLAWLHKQALAAGRVGDSTTAFEWIGEALHLIQDSYSQAHTARDNISIQSAPHPIRKVRFFGFVRRLPPMFSLYPHEHQVKGYSLTLPIGDPRDDIYEPPDPARGIAKDTVLRPESQIAIYASVDFLKMMLDQLKRGLSPDDPIAKAELEVFINWHLSSNPIPPPGPRPTPSPSTGHPLLRYGSRGPAVRELQARLNSWLVNCAQLGFPPLVIDGIFGPLTRRMVRTFQHAEGLRADGIVGPLTWGRLLGSRPSPVPLSPQPTPPLPGSGYPQVSRFVPARYFTRPARPRQINRIVIHITDGTTTNGTVFWFRDMLGPDGRPAVDRRGRPIKSSAHYVVGQDGEVVQMVRDSDIAHHAHNANADSIGIEHVARARNPRLVPSQAQYCSSADLVRWLCARYNIPMDRIHILGHSEADPDTTHTDCPNSVWDWNRYMALVTGAVRC